MLWKAGTKVGVNVRAEGRIDANPGLQVPCSPASSLERETGIEPATASLGFLSLITRHVTSPSEFIAYGYPHDPRVSRLVTPSHAIWAASGGSSR
jgi:hypothetical protein